jgi:hypothetical protein
VRAHHHQQPPPHLDRLRSQCHDVVAREFFAGAGIDRLDRLFVTNYDEAHVSGYPNLLANVTVDVLVRNPSVLPGILQYLKSEDGKGNGIDMLVRSIERVFTGGAPSPFDDFGDTSFYWNNYGVPPLASWTRIT